MDRLRKIMHNSTETVPLSAKVMCIGSSEENDIVLFDDRAPEVAAKIETEGDTYTIEPVRSGAVRVNGKKVKSAQLGPGDKIEIGTSTLVFERDLTGRSAAEAASGNMHSVLSSISRFAEKVGTERNLKKLLQKVTETLVEVIGGTEAFIFTLNKDEKLEVFASSGTGDPEERFSDTIVQEALGSGRGVCIPNALSDPQFSGARSIVDLQLTSVLCCPIIIAQKTLGVVYLGSSKPSVSYTDSDLDTLRIYALIAGMLVNHVRFISEQDTVIKRLADLRSEEGIVARSEPMRRVIDEVEAVAPAEMTVLLQGETGAGKDVIAQLIHNKSPRCAEQFVAVNCSSLHGELLESELFGHKKGAFTGAVRDHKGLFASANKGTLFLDEIGEMGLSLQAKLLRTLETGMIRPVGASREEPVDCRIVCASNQDLESMVSQGRFREDLYYRLNQFTITLPPLRQRDEDIRLLAYFFLERYRAQYPAKDVMDFHPDTLKAMTFYEWPGNVRELASAVHKAVLTAQGPLAKIEFNTRNEPELSFEQATREFQRKLFNKALASSKGNKEKAASLLGMSRSTFFRHLSSLNSDKDDGE